MSQIVNAGAKLHVRFTDQMASSTTRAQGGTPKPHNPLVEGDLEGEFKSWNHLKVVGGPWTVKIHTNEGVSQHKGTPPEKKQRKSGTPPPRKNKNNYLNQPRTGLLGSGGFLLGCPLSQLPKTHGSGPPASPCSSRRSRPCEASRAKRNARWPVGSPLFGGSLRQKNPKQNSDSWLPFGLLFLSYYLLILFI